MTCEVGFPSEILIEPVMPWVRHLAAQVNVAIAESICWSPELTCRFKMDKLPFVRSKDLFWIALGYVGMGRDAGKNTYKFGWIFQETKDVYDSLEPTEQDELIIRHDGSHTRDVNLVLFTECYSLLEQFNPKRWAAKIEKDVSLTMVDFRPTNLLWAQVLLLDVAIQFLIRGQWHSGDTVGYDIWTKEVVAVITALVNSWECSEAQPPHGFGAEKLSPPAKQPAIDVMEWDLIGGLRKQSDLFVNPEPPVRDQKLQKLAGLLQLRALFFLAFLMLIPDSSEVYLAEKSNVEMPMI
jgi:hypothetical protein